MTGRDDLLDAMASKMSEKATEQWLSTGHLSMRPLAEVALDVVAGTSFAKEE